MRTTIDLDDKLYNEIKLKAESSKRTIREVIHNALISVFYPKKSNLKKFKVIPHASAFKAGIDQEKLSDLAQDLEVEEAVKILK